MIIGAWGSGDPDNNLLFEVDMPFVPTVGTLVEWSNDEGEWSGIVQSVRLALTEFGVESKTTSDKGATFSHVDIVVKEGD